MTPRFSVPPSGARRDVVLLGSTGSIGTQALDVIARNPDRFRVTAIAAGGADPALLAKQAAVFKVAQVAVADPKQAGEVQMELAALLPIGQRPEVLIGPAAASQVAKSRCDVVLNGMTGAVGLAPTLAALAAGNLLALANKESLIIGGALVKRAAAPGQIVPVDSEHSAIAQALLAGRADEVHRLVLTASGGPFRGRSREQLAEVTLAEALDHPTWAMGPVVTINSATLVNKGLEVIEAHLLFDVPLDRIVVMVHPQSVIHSLVEFTDGSTVAQLSPPDMRLPIAWGLAWPDRVPGAAPSVDWTTAHRWTLDPLDTDAFPAVALARGAGEAGGTAPAVFNAANEVAVAAFQAGSVGFLDIVDIVGAVLAEHLAGQGSEPGAAHVPDSQLSADAVLAADAWARLQAASSARASELVRAGGAASTAAADAATSQGES
jgi:1-deoxy-D-xylulose-5-phosphate reductoisomerase